MTIGVQRLMLEVERVRDDFQAAIFGTRAGSADPGAALGLAAPDCVLTNLPMATGSGPGGLRRYLVEELAPHLPAGLEFHRLTRTGDRWRVVDETVVTFTHDRELPWLLPGVAPSGRRVEVLAISVVTVRRGLITSHRTLWDATALPG